MGLLGKVAAYRWLSSGRGSGGAGSGGLVILFLIIAIVVGIVWAVGTFFSFLWDLIYSIIHPILATAPIITLPASVILVGLLFARLNPYSYDAATSYLDGDEEKLTHTERTIWVVASINAIFLFESEILHGIGGLLGTLIMLAVALLAIYGFFELFHTPYRCARLLLNAPQGQQLVVLFLAPILFIIISSSFNVHLPLPEINSDAVAFAAGLGLMNATYLGGPLVVHRKKTAIRRGARKRMQSNDTDA